ncbi:hypothetical protein MBM09_15140 [Flaviramulus sp. BrNp1-15]|uniref:hypothetical protein n=1 Tax=Flaviramulus sp. BrNp1-15 TaxID=2916754 RepID=UPI001EE99D4F|nr:hypothetical protein [Flaviramulus sp. BrNp1-15]ULC59228.1 hypothetical protein MBM09_15140 [Flaviramulus sp. BrNp1-15]
MAPLKYEEQLKNKLEKRTLQPSENAWEKLSNRLDEESGKKNNKSFWWLGIAASVVGILFVATQLWNTNSSTEVTPKVVTTPETIQEEETIKIVLDNVNKNHITDKEEVKKIDKNDIVKTQNIKKVLPNKPLNENQIVSSNTDENLNIITPEEKTTDLPQNNTLTFEEQKIQDVVAQVKELKNTNNEVTDADIDALLLEAQKEIKLNRLYNETTGIVDANALLQDVEEELDLSFRSKVFEAIKSSYNSVKTAVANRNN